MIRSLVCTILISIISVTSAIAQNGDAVPTLVPPTLVPVQKQNPELQSDLTESGIATIRENNLLRVGILFNETPFGQMNIRGDVSGFDADLARSIADIWGVDVAFEQVTRQNAVDKLFRDEVDVLIANFAHNREWDATLAFSQSYHVGSQSMMVRSDDPVESLGEMANRRIGVVAKSAGAEALEDWRIRSGIPVEVQTFVNLDQAYVALAQGEVDGVVDRRQRLQNVSILQPDLIKILSEPVAVEPYAVVMKHDDVPLRQQINRTIQFLIRNGRLLEVHNANLPGQQYHEDSLVVWNGLGDQLPSLGELDVTIPVLTPTIISRIEAGQPLRVAGVADTNLGNDSALRVNSLNRSLVEEMAARWGVSIEYVPNSYQNPLEFVANGQADLAVGMQPTWDMIQQVDFSQPYAMFGDRLIVKMEDDISVVGELDRERLGVMDSDGNAVERAEAWMESQNVTMTIEPIREQDVAFQMLVEDNVDAVFGDSIKLNPHLQANQESLGSLDRWFTRNYFSLAMPTMDQDFRLLVDYTLQDMMQDGTLDRLTSSIMPPGELPQFEVWPGSNVLLSSSP